MVAIHFWGIVPTLFTFGRGFETEEGLIFGPDSCFPASCAQHHKFDTCSRDTINALFSDRALFFPADAIRSCESGPAMSALSPRNGFRSPEENLALLLRATLSILEPYVQEARPEDQLLELKDVMHRALEHFERASMRRQEH